jgi:hypothetical protein
MQSNDLTEEQARALNNKLQPILGYLSKLKRRMVFKGFRPNDAVLRRVVEAEAAMHRLSVGVPSMPCWGGCGGGRRTKL